MASAQCHISCEESCPQKNHHTSLGQKLSGLFKGHHHSNNVDSSCTQCHTQTHPPKTQRHGRSKREHKKNLLERIKDGFSSDSSDSDSDNENSHKRKN